MDKFVVGARVMHTSKKQGICGTIVEVTDIAGYFRVLFDGEDFGLVYPMYDLSVVEN